MWGGGREQKEQLITILETLQPYTGSPEKNGTL
jgi:hypothetical protein